MSVAVAFCTQSVSQSVRLVVVVVVVVVDFCGGGSGCCFPWHRALWLWLFLEVR